MGTMTNSEDQDEMLHNEQSDLGLLCMVSHNWSTYEQQHEISSNVVCATTKGSDQPAHVRSLIRAFSSLRNIL